MEQFVDLSIIFSSIWQIFSQVVGWSYFNGIVVLDFIFRLIAIFIFIGAVFVYFLVRTKVGVENSELDVKLESSFDFIVAPALIGAFFVIYCFCSALAFSTILIALFSGSQLIFNHEINLVFDESLIFILFFILSFLFIPFKVFSNIKSTKLMLRTFLISIKSIFLFMVESLFTFLFILLETLLIMLLLAISSNLDKFKDGILLFIFGLIILFIILLLFMLVLFMKIIESHINSNYVLGGTFSKNVLIFFHLKYKNFHNSLLTKTKQKIKKK
jgi:hypothetical protein